MCCTISECLLCVAQIILIQNSVIQPVMCHSNFTTEKMESHSDKWVVRIFQGISKAQLIATQLGFDFHGEISAGLPNFYLFSKSKYPVNMQYAEEHLTSKLLKKSEITWAQRQSTSKVIQAKLPLYKQIRKGVSRSRQKFKKTHQYPNHTSISQCLNLNDQYWPQQYYLNCKDIKRQRVTRDLNLGPVWTKHHLFGENIKIIVVDDGVLTTHPDLIDNYDSDLGLDLQDNDASPDPKAILNNKFTHGTCCAGIIAMRANNTICGVGIAPLATLGAVRLLGPKDTNDYERAKALLFKYTDVHVSSNSWILEHEKWKRKPLTDAALKTGSTQGRGGRGLIYVFPSGSSRLAGKTCGGDLIRTSIYTITVGSCDHRGNIVAFSERCSSIMVTTYSGDTSPLTGPNVISTKADKYLCTKRFGGTCASAPMVSAAVALALQANLFLTWRDVQHLLAWTSQAAPLKHNRRTWIKNGAGFYVSYDFGFGMLNINDLVEKAKVFQSVGPMNSCISRANFQADGLLFRGSLEVKIESDGCRGRPAEVGYLEHVQVGLSLTCSRRDKLEIILISPLGTKAILLLPDPYDSVPLKIQNWTLDSVMTWGEDPKGTWTLLFTGKDGKLDQLYLSFHGTSCNQKPEHYNNCDSKIL